MQFIKVNKKKNTGDEKIPNKSMKDFYCKKNLSEKRNESLARTTY
jgi:hypothetical protein